MSRIRTIKPEFFTDEKVALLSLEARYLWIGIWTIADDFGSSKGHPSFLKQVYMYDKAITEERIAELVEELVRLGFVRPYTVNGQSYLQTCKWSVHQKVDHPKKFRNPPPPPGFFDVPEDSGDLREVLAKPSRKPSRRIF